MGNHEVHRGDNEQKVRLALFDLVFEPVELLLAQHSGFGVAGVVHIVKAAVASGIKQKEVAVRYREFSVAPPTN